MRSTLMFAVASALVATSVASDAPKVTGNPTDVTYKATIANDNKNGVSGFVEIGAWPPGQRRRHQVPIQPPNGGRTF
ncbi:hypothetical protein VE04_07449, partial [Pseudogymnoascus sp. 24MN13]